MVVASLAMSPDPIDPLRYPQWPPGRLPVSGAEPVASQPEVFAQEAGLMRAGGMGKGTDLCLDLFCTRQFLQQPQEVQVFSFLLKCGPEGRR